jgi:TonB family protein
MAPQTRLEETVPSTLPDDFNEWDSGGPPTTLPDDFEGFDSPPAPVHETAVPKSVTLPPVVIREPDFTALRSLAARPVPSPAPVAAPFPVSISKKPESVLSLAPVAAYAQEEDFLSPHKLYQVRSEPESDDTDKRPKTIKMVIIGAVVLVVLLLAILVPIVLRRSPAKNSVVVVAHPVVTYSEAETQADQSPTKPAAATPAGQFPNKPGAATPQQQTASAANVSSPGSQPPVQSDLMDRQLSEPSRIPQNIKNPEKEAAPPTGFAAGGLEGLGAASNGGIGTSLGRQASPNVRVAAPKFVSISSGVAQGMLIQRTTPTYPSIAKSARVAGTVVLQATISKTGSIESVKAVSGPEMLRQAAVDAVRSWRYKPYMLDNQPIEMQTSVSVVFSLAGGE